MAKNEHPVEVIHSWCTPRSLSTSLMYSFAQEKDIQLCLRLILNALWMILSSFVSLLVMIFYHICLH
ncbi:hypothetical protein K1719_016789 [Acacia pycnantha]|nr:hypothetical protein K1719_016789 [Acacia pycnantha]